MLDSLVGTILTDARTVLDDLDPFLLELEVAAERSDASLLSTIYNTTPILGCSFTLLGLSDAATLVDLLHLVTGGFKKGTVSLAYVNVREVVRGFSALIAFLDSAENEKVSVAIASLTDLVHEIWGTEADGLLAQHALVGTNGGATFAVSGHVLQEELLSEGNLFVLELDSSGMLAGTQFTPFSLLQFLFKSGQVVDVQFAPPASGAYLHVLYATILSAEQLQMVLDIPAAAIVAVPLSVFTSSTPTWTRASSLSGAEAEEHSPVAASDMASGAFSIGNDAEPVVPQATGESPRPHGSDEAESIPPEEPSRPEVPVSFAAGDDKYAMLEAELDGELWDLALSEGLTEKALAKAAQELPEQAEATPEGTPELQSEAAPVYASEPDVAPEGAVLPHETGVPDGDDAEARDAEAVDQHLRNAATDQPTRPARDADFASSGESQTRQVVHEAARVRAGEAVRDLSPHADVAERPAAVSAERSHKGEADVLAPPVTQYIHGYRYEQQENSVRLYVGRVVGTVQAEALRMALLELIAAHHTVDLVLRESIRGDLGLLQMLLSAAMTAGLKRQTFVVSGKGKASVATLLAGCGITADILKAQGIAEFLK